MLFRSLRSVTSKLGRTGESQLPLGFRSLRTRAFLARVNSFSPVLQSLDVTDRRGTARSLTYLVPNLRDHSKFSPNRRMSRVCRNWKRVASESRLWQNVNLSRMSSEFPKSATDSNIGKLAGSKLKGAREISLDGWSELTDVGLKVNQFH